MDYQNHPAYDGGTMIGTFKMVDFALCRLDKRTLPKPPSGAISMLPHGAPAYPFAWRSPLAAGLSPILHVILPQ